MGPLEPWRLRAANLVIFGGPREMFSSDEFTAIKEGGKWCVDLLIRFLFGCFLTCLFSSWKNNQKWLKKTTPRRLEYMGWGWSFEIDDVLFSFELESKFITSHNVGLHFRYLKFLVISLASIWWFCWRKALYKRVSKPFFSDGLKPPTISLLSKSRPGRWWCFFSKDGIGMCGYFWCLRFFAQCWQNWEAFQKHLEQTELTPVSGKKSNPGTAGWGMINQN